MCVCVCVCVCVRARACVCVCVCVNAVFCLKESCRSCFGSQYWIAWMSSARASRRVKFSGSSQSDPTQSNTDDIAEDDGDLLSCFPMVTYRTFNLLLQNTQ